MDFGRRRFRVALTGTDILIHSEETDDPIVGFRAIRFVRARNSSEARSIAVARVRNEWFSSPFCSANRAQAPVITVDGIEVIRNPFRRSRPNRGYDFFRGGGGPAKDAAPTGGAPGQTTKAEGIAAGGVPQEDVAV